MHNLVLGFEVIAITAALAAVAYLMVRFPIVLGLYLAGVTAAAFLVPPISEGGENTVALIGAPIVFFHVPLARVCALGFMLAAWYGGVYLVMRRPDDDIKSAAAAEVGFLFAFLATVTGAFFSRLNWGAFWDWNEPRQTSAFFMLLIYGAYLALRGSLEESDTRARLSSIYAIIAFFSAVFLIFGYPYVVKTKTLHPSVQMEMAPVYKTVLNAAMLGYAGLWIWLFRAAVAVMKKEAMTQTKFAPTAAKGG